MITGLLRMLQARAAPADLQRPRTRAQRPTGRRVGRLPAGRLAVRGAVLLAAWMVARIAAWIAALSAARMAVRMAVRMAARMAVLLAALMAVAGCATPGEQPLPAATITPIAAGLDADAATDADFPDTAWWRALGDPALDALIDRGLAGQPGLQAAAARLAAVAADTQALSASHFPQFGLLAEPTRERFSENGLFPPAVAGATRNLATLRVNGQWELDFFGRHAAALQAALGQQRAAAAELQAARVLLTTRLARGWVDLARLLALQAVAERTLAQREDQLALTRRRVAAGLDTALELRLAQGPVPDTRQQIEQLDGQIVLARHALAVLSGQAPQARAAARPTLAPLQWAVLPDRLGADLLGRRADVVAARWRVEAAQAQVTGAQADFYPDINLIGQVGLNALGLDRLLLAGSRQVSAGLALRLPLFDGAYLRARLGARSAEADAAVAAYNAAVLDAAREVADAGALLRSLQRQQGLQAEAADAAEGAWRLATQRHEAGLSSYLSVLAAESAVLVQRSGAAELKARTLDTQLALVRALGGGWRDEPPAKAAR